ncbi:hypothetical protein SAMN02787148_108105 [Burkholderia vietnamiensis]|nr:hypothetical protein SAMN02787148_108105 [Burkholderia vietnamiensis]SFX78641.1 hypothetical protein SAMN02787160_108106 [Burkholderia vietnamiensis]
MTLIPTATRSRWRRTCPARCPGLPSTTTPSCIAATCSSKSIRATIARGSTRRAHSSASRRRNSMRRACSSTSPACSIPRSTARRVRRSSRRTPLTGRRWPLPQGAVAVSGRARRGAAMVGGAATGGAGRVADDDGSRRAVQGARRRVADVGYGGGCEDGGCGVERCGVEGCGAERCGVAVTRGHIGRVSIARGPHGHARENSSESASLKRMRTGSA